MEGEGGDKQKFHSNEHSCNFCGKSFPAKSRLIIHERSHTGEKPFSCDLCKKTNSRNDKLNKHKRIHTGEKSYEFNTCKVRILA